MISNTTATTSSQHDTDDNDNESSAVVLFVYSPNNNITQLDHNLRTVMTRLQVDSSSVMTIQGGSFANCHRLVTVEFISNTKSMLKIIGQRAFENCPALTEIVIPSSVTRIQDGAFMWCRSLTTVTFLCNDESSALQYIGKQAFVGTSLQSLVLPNSVETIDDEAFDGCHLLTHLELKNQKASGRLKTIGSRAFASCARLTEIAILPSSVESSMGSGAFAWCKSLIRVHLPNHGSLKTISDNLFERCLALEHITIPNTVETIGSRAFEYCTKLETVHFPETSSLRSIRYRAFAGCVSLQNLLGGNFTSSSSSSLVSIGEAAFVECKSLRNVQLPQSLKHLGGFAFAECHSLRTVSIPNHTVREIQHGTFQGCFSLTEVDLPQEGLEAIGDRAFAHCESLSAISLPQSLYMIGRSFHGCKNLLGVEIPKQADFIMTYRPPCFSDCSSLVTVSIPPSTMGESMVHAFADCERLQKCIQDQDDGHQPRLRDRFQNLPVHEVCYHASTSTMDELYQALDSIDRDTCLVDDYGMTPCHIVATSSKLRLDMFTLLLDRYSPLKILWIRDCHDFSAMDYLLVHRSDSRAIPLIKLTLEKAIGCWMEGWGLDTWRLDMIHRVEDSSIPWSHDNDIETRQEQLLEVLDRLESYRQMEATSIVELALWKMAMDRHQVTGPDVLPRDRANYRLLCGGDVVLPNLMEFLWDDNGEDVYWI